MFSTYALIAIIIVLAKVLYIKNTDPDKYREALETTEDILEELNIYLDPEAALFLLILLFSWLVLIIALINKISKFITGEDVF